jgi:hypothetical protein
VAANLGFPVRSVNLLSRPDLDHPGHGAQRRVSWTPKMRQVAKVEPCA